MNPWLRNLLLRAGGGGGGAVLPSAGLTFLTSKSSLILDEGTGDPTWSRATKAWGFNELGYLEELASGCAFFGGARLVRNAVKTNSEDFTGWPDNAGFTRPSANLLVCSNSTTAHAISQNTVAPPTIAGGNYFFRYRVEYVDIRFVQLTCNSAGFWASAFCNFDLVAGTYNATGVTAAITAVNPGVWDLSIKATATANAALGFGCAFAAVNGLTDTRFQAFVGDGVKSVRLRRADFVDVTNYDASYVPEYVSVGVEASPYFGAGIDGAKYFETDWQGAPIAAANLLGFRREASAINNLLRSRDFVGPTWTESGGSFTSGAWIPSVTGSSLVTNGDFASDLSGWTNNGASTNTWSGGKANIDGTGGTGGIYQILTTTIGKTYLITVAMTVISGAGYAVVAVQGATVGSSTIRYDGSAASKNISIIFKATLASHALYAYSSAGRVAQFDDVVVKECTCAPERTATGLDGLANTATTLTATAADAIILQPISLASAARCSSAYIKRRTGTGTISFTQDGGSTWTDITSQINSSTWSRVEITATLANPSVGFKISTSGDAIDVDCVQNEAGAKATSPIVTTTAAVTRNADSLTYQTASNWSDTAGTAYIEAQPLAWVAGGAIGSATNGLLLSAANSGATASDGTNTANGPAGSPSGRKKLALRWGGGAMTVASGGVVGTAGTYDGGMGLASVGIAVNSSTYCGPVAIYNYQMTDAELQAITA